VKLSKYRLQGRRARVQRGSGTDSFLADADLSLRCVDCGKLRFSTTREVMRASRLRCLGCGGLLVESQASEFRSRVLAEQRYGASPLDASRDIPCPSCPAMFRTGVALQLHREDRHGAVNKFDPSWN
jgi:hypothetical protein